MEKKKKQIDQYVAQKTYPLTQVQDKEPQSNTTRPPQKGVQDAKDWVDSHEM